MNEVMTQTEAAAFLRCDEEVLEHRRLAGEIVYVDGDDQVLYLRDDLMNFLRSRRKRCKKQGETAKSKKPIAEPVFENQISFDTAQVSAITTIPYGTVLSEIRNGALVARKAGRKYYVHRDSLNEYLKCPAPKSQPASISALTPVSGSSAMAAETSEQAALATLTSQLRKKSSRNT